MTYRIQYEGPNGEKCLSGTMDKKSAEAIVEAKLYKGAEVVEEASMQTCGTCIHFKQASCPQGHSKATQRYDSCASWNGA